MSTAQNKTNLNRAKQRKQTYGRYLPALELKQQQLLEERRKTEDAMASAAAEVAALKQRVYAQLPMLAAEGIALEGLVSIRALVIVEENVVGVLLPVIQTLELERQAYGFLARPHWVEALADHWENMLQLQLTLDLQRRRMQLLEAAVRKVTQRVNLFSKVLIPAAQNDIHRIGIFLADQDRAAVVRSKIAKQRLRDSST